MWDVNYMQYYLNAWVWYSRCQQSFVIFFNHKNSLLIDDLNLKMKCRYLYLNGFIRLNEEYGTFPYK